MLDHPVWYCWIIYLWCEWCGCHQWGPSFDAPGRRVQVCRRCGALEDLDGFQYLKWRVKNRE